MKSAKQCIVLFLVLTLLLSCAVTGSWASESEDTMIQTIRALGIMTGDGNGNLNLDAPVTRAQFAKMTVAASRFKDTVSEGGSGYSLYKDLKSSHWASEYIRVNVEQSWMIGYTDGTFRPNNQVTLEEACTVLLRMLGYDSSSMAGSFPTAQLNKASAVGLRDGISAARGTQLTRRECAILFYNLLTASNSSGQTYAQTIGVTLTNGKVEYSAIVKDSLEGPFVASAGEKLTFTPQTTYLNNVEASVSLKENDVYYYSEEIRTLWIYNKKVSGKITSLLPSSFSPTSITISGKTYSIDSSAAYQMSVFAGTAANQYATLLLGMDDVAAGILSNGDVDTRYFGIVQSISRNTDTGSDSADLLTTLQIICTDGAAKTFTLDTSVSVKEGSLVSVYVTGSGVSVSSVSEKLLTGFVSARGDALDIYDFAADIQILDTTEKGQAISVEPERLAGAYMNSSSVRYYTLNSDNEIDCLILNDVTGDLHTYAYMTAAVNNSIGMNISASYTYLVNGQSQRMTLSTAYSVKEGGIAITNNLDGSIAAMKQLSSAKLTNLGTRSVQAGSTRYYLDDNVQVYLVKNDEYYQTTVAALNAGDFELTGWYDDFDCPAGGRIRIITAKEKEPVTIIE